MEGLARGAAARPRRGVYALPLADRVQVARIAWWCEPTCIAAARRIGLPVTSHDDRLHMAVTGDRSSVSPNAWSPRSVVVHTTGRLKRGSTRAVDVINSATRCASRSEPLEMVDSAL